MENIYPGTRASDPNNLVAIGDTLYFTATDPVNGVEPRFVTNNAVINSFRWSGAVSTDWHNPSNWLQNRLPDSKAVVLIPSGAFRYPIISQNTVIKQMTVAPNALVTLNENIKLKVTVN